MPLIANAPNARLLAELRKANLRQPKSETLSIWLGLAESSLSFEDFLVYARAHARLPLLAIDTTGACDLKCPGMCYYHPDIELGRTPVEEVRLHDAIHQAACELGLRTLVFAGKEPLLNASRMFRLMQEASKWREDKFRIGIATNGRNLNRHWETLKNAAEAGWFDFLDVSIDSGNAAQHDAIRGVSGTFVLAQSALQRCCEELPGIRVGCSSVLRRDNATGILDLIRDTRFCKRFYVVPMVPPIFTKSVAPNWKEISFFLQQLVHLLETELAGSGMEVMMSLLGIYLHDAERDGWIQWADVSEDQNGLLYVDRIIAGNRLSLHLLPLPETAWRTGRLTYAGDYLPNTHFLQDANLERVAVGNLGENDLRTLLLRSLDDDAAWPQIVRSRTIHNCQHRPCWPTCFGGFSVAEQSQLSGMSLGEQPAICCKIEADFELGESHIESLSSQP